MGTRIIAVLLLSLCHMAFAGSPAPAITVRDLTPQFLAFYRTAERERADPDRRWELWKSMYHFAAVPPTPEGDNIARRLLDEAWPKYAGVLTRIEKGAGGIEPLPSDTLARVIIELRPDSVVRVKLLAYVGALEGNAFTVAGADGIPVVAIPVEQSPEERGPILAHEFAHAVQISMGTMKGGWVRTVGETVLAEGLAMRVAQRLYPNLPAQSFVENEPGWYAKAEHLHRAILKDVREALASDKSDDVMRYTMGKAGAGIDREAYYAGWLVTDYWLHHGVGLAQIARIPEGDAPKRVKQAIDAMLAEH